MNSRAIITMVHNEGVFFPIWLRYYSQFFKPEDIYVIDHETIDGSTSGDGFIRIPVTHDTVDWQWRSSTTQELQHKLLQKYEMVLCTDVDEIVAPNPTTGDLGTYLDSFQQDFVTCKGYEILHLKESEPPFDLSKSVLAQRSWWFYCPAYSKSVLAKVPIFWYSGFHLRADRLTNPDPNLYLIHLHRMDYNICLNRHTQRMSRPWIDSEIKEGSGYQNRIVEPEEFNRWFYNDSHCSTPIVTEQIPDIWKNLF